MKQLWQVGSCPLSATPLEVMTRRRKGCAGESQPREGSKDCESIGVAPLLRVTGVTGHPGAPGQALTCHVCQLGCQLAKSLVSGSLCLKMDDQGSGGKLYEIESWGTTEEGQKEGRTPWVSSSSGMPS